MKCKDCVCSDVCYYKAFNDVRHVKRRDDVEKVCKSFVNRDAVEVVRCKDCKHHDNSEGIFWCHLNSKFYPGGMDWHSFPEDGFCSYGERMIHK